MPETKPSPPQPGRFATRALFIVALALAGAASVTSYRLALATSRHIPAAARSVAAKGEFAGDLNWLKRFHAGPQSPGESNHYIDLWSPGGLRVLTTTHGLTNNRTLFVDSHGKAGFGPSGLRHGFYPHRTLADGPKPPAYSARDLATLLGPADASAIHNIVLASCNGEGRLRSAEFRKHFVNATNITYMAAGKLAYKPMLYQAITQRSDDIRPMHGRVLRSTDEKTETAISASPSPGSEPLGFYQADLFLPGAAKPFRTQRAGMELLAPNHQTPSVSVARR